MGRSLHLAIQPRFTLPPTNIAPAGGYQENQFPLEATLCEVLC